MIELLVSLALAQSGPVARADKFLSSSQSFVLEYTVRSPQIVGAGKGRAEVTRPDMQRTTLQWAGQSFEFVHSSEGGLSIRHDRKEYFESPALKTNMIPPPTLSDYADVATPTYVFGRTLTAFASGAKFTGKGKEAVRGVGADVVSVVVQDQFNPGTHTFWIGPDGRILRWHKVVQGDGESSYEVTAEITKVDPVPSDPSRYKIKLPLGYVPTELPGPRYWSVAVPGRAPLGTWLDARRNGRVDVAGLHKGSAVAIVFTAPECDVCATIEPFLVDLRRRLKQKDCALIEVVLGRAKPSLARKDKERPVYWDDKGAIESAFGPVGTPTIFLADKSGNLVTAWQGYSKEREQQIVKTFIDALDEG